MGSSSSCSKVSPDSISSPYKYISDLEDSYYNSKAIKMKPIIFSQQQRKKVIVPKCVWFKRFEIKYAFPIIPICCDGENVDFNVGCDYYFINNNNEIGYLKLTYEENDSITPRVEHEIVREVNKKLLNDNDVTYIPEGTKCTLSFSETILVNGIHPPRIIPKYHNNSSVYHVNNNNEQLKAIRKQTFDKKIKQSANKYQKINEIQVIQNFDEENDHSGSEKWVYQDYDHSYDPIPKINYDYIYYFENKSQKKEIGLNDEYYYPVIAFRGVYNDRVFFFYGPSLFVVSNTKQIADAQMFVSRYSYGPFYLSSEFRSPSNTREKKLVRQMKKFFKKDCIYQQNPAIYPNFAMYGLPAYGIDTASYYIKDFVPMGDVINLKQIVEDFLKNR